MEASNVILMVMFSFCGIILCLIGYHIKKNQEIESIQIPGLNVREIKDKKGFAAFVGNSLKSMGIVSLLIGPSIFLMPVIKMFVLLMFIITLIATCFRLILGVKKFEK